MDTRTIDQLLHCSMTSYALAYIGQIDGIATMTRKELVSNINALYGFDDIKEPEYMSTKALRYELEYQLDREWNPDKKLWREVTYWRNKAKCIEANEDAQYGAEWVMFS